MSTCIKVTYEKFHKKFTVLHASNETSHADRETSEQGHKLAKSKYLALINRVGGLYGRILTEVCTHDRGQDSPIQTNLARLIRCLLYGKHKNNLIYFK